MSRRPDLYVWIPGWERFQHYKDRGAPWIKAYVDLLSNDAYLDLTGHRRAVLHGLWLEYARCGAGDVQMSASRPRRYPDDDPTMTQRHPDDVATTPRRLPGDARTISRRLGMKVSTSDLESLKHAGFVELVASTALAERYSVASDLASGQLALPARARALAPEAEAEREKEDSSDRSKTTRRPRAQANGLPVDLELGKARLLAAAPRLDVALLEQFDLPPAAWQAAAEELGERSELDHPERYAYSLFESWRAEGRYTTIPAEGEPEPDLPAKESVA